MTSPTHDDYEQARLELGPYAIADEIDDRAAEIAKEREEK